MGVTLLETSIIFGIYMSYSKGSFSIMRRRKDSLPFVKWLQFCRNKKTSADDLLPNCQTHHHIPKVQSVNITEVHLKRHSQVRPVNR